MGAQTYHSVVLAKRPKDQIVAGETFSLESKPTPTEADLQDGQVFVEVLYLSLDPAMRGWLNGRYSYALSRHICCLANAWSYGDLLITAQLMHCVS